jgi:MFS superfamily sulfate permease-like transporter
MSAVFLLLIVLLVAPLAAYLPVPSMAAILFIVAWGLIDFHHIGEILKRHKRESIVLAITFVGTLVDLEKGIFLGILVSCCLPVPLAAVDRDWSAGKGRQPAEVRGGHDAPPHS